MKKILFALLLVLAFALKPNVSSAQATWEDGYDFAFQYAVEHCLSAAEAHPEWSFLIVPKSYNLMGGVFNFYTVVDGTGQAAMLASTYVQVSYLDGFLANMNLSDYHNGLYYGFLAGCGAFAMGIE